MFQFPGFALLSYFIQIIVSWLLRMGCPIRKSPGQRLLSTSPKLIAANYVLHRFLVSRHPPYALVLPLLNLNLCKSKVIFRLAVSNYLMLTVCLHFTYFLIFAWNIKTNWSSRSFPFPPTSEPNISIMTYSVFKVRLMRKLSSVAFLQTIASVPSCIKNKNPLSKRDQIET